MRIAIGADHRGYAMKLHLKQNFVMHADHVVDWIDVGCANDTYCDYPPYAIDVAELLQNKEVDRGVLICGSGVGMSIAANRYFGIYAGLVWNNDTARLARQHDNVNVLVLPSDFVSNEDALQMVHIWLNAEFLGDTYQKRLTMIDEIG
ncbi:MAG: RpiB/LacA/LacB family sugar-phosphate isomerase [Candidatus Babeliales bacterium]